jgi:large subunit ribosomal protein LP1
MVNFQVTGSEKDQLVVSFAALLLHDSGVEISADNISNVVKASGNSVAAYYPTLFATYIEKAGGVDKFLVGPSAGGAAPAASGSAPAAAGGAPAKKEEEKPKVEEVDALDGGMDMFGGKRISVYTLQLFSNFLFCRWRWRRRRRLLNDHLLFLSL